jgi:hypothetical protein
VRLRYAGAAAAAVLAVTGLAGCKNNVGTAAVIDGHRITESDVSHYLTVKAQPVIERNANGQTITVSPRSFVVSELINQKLYFKVIGAIPSVSKLTETQLDSQLQSDLQGKSVTQVAESLGLHGFTEDFYRIVLRAQEEVLVLRSAQSNGVDVSAAIHKVHFPVTVSPRYGTWDPKTLAFTAGGRLPGYLDLQPGAGVPQGLTGNS